MIRNLINISDHSLTLTDLNGKLVEVEEIFDGLFLGEQRLKDSVSVQLALLNNELAVSDGTLTYYRSQAIDLIKGYAIQTTRDGKPITTNSDRPKDHYRCYTGRGDDLSLGKIGEGQNFTIFVEPNESEDYVDAKFLDDVYIKDGEVIYENAVFDTHLTCFVICPPNTPFPSPTATGTLDLIDGQFVANLTGSGQYMTAPVEVKLFRFINNLHILGNNRTTVTSVEPFLVYTPYFLRFIVSVPSAAVRSLPVNIAINMGLYRRKTL